VPDALVEWRGRGIRTYIYSSGSRLAQKDLFGHTTAGDLRPYLCGYFDTTSGPKVCVRWRGGAVGGWGGGASGGGVW
jgi:methylthioribulose 1-phosphate dehydratase/enolase-phosphatase E1